MTHPKPHSLIAKTLHWGFIAVFVYAIIKQIDGIEELSDPALLRFEIIFAFGFLLLLLVRFVYMRLTRPTALPDDTPKHMRLMARAGHLAIYVSLSMIAISGLLIGLLYQMGGPEATGMGLAIGLHEVAVMASYITIAIHIAAALYHRFKGDGIWSAMVPLWKER